MPGATPRPAAIPSTFDSAYGVRVWVKQALQGKVKGQWESYNNLLQQLRDLKAEAARGEFEAILSDLLRAISQSVSILDYQLHRTLITEIMNLSIWLNSKVIRDSLLELVSHMVVAKGSMADACMSLLVSSLFRMKPPQAAEDMLPGLGWVPNAEELLIQDDVIACIRKIIVLVPTAPPRIIQLAAASAPSKHAPLDVQCLYLRGMAQLAEGANGATVRDELLATMVNQLISVDIEIKWQDIVDAMADAAQEEENAAEEAAKAAEEEVDIFALEAEAQQRQAPSHGEDAGKLLHDPISGRGGWEGATAAAQDAQPSSTEPERPAAQPSREMASTSDETADKLDAMMEQVMQHLGRRWDMGQGHSCWRGLLSAFERFLLPTQRSKFAQFLMFHAAQKDPGHCCRSFIDLLLKRLADERLSPIYRSACAAYLASFLARASFVSHHVVAGALRCLASWALEYAASQDFSAASLNGTPGGRQQASDPVSLLQINHSHLVNAHQAFYAACQGMLYVLCYRLESLLAATAVQTPPVLRQRSAVDQSMQGAGSPAQATRSMFLQLVVPLLHHRFRPLAVCVPNVVREFHQQSVRYQLMDWTSLQPELDLHAIPLDPHAPSQPADATTDGNYRRSRPLEMFFPFDPYLLPKSAKALSLPTTYIEWRGGRASTAAEAKAGPADDEAGVQAGMDEDLGEDEEDSGLESSSESDAEDGDIEMPSASPLSHRTIGRSFSERPASGKFLSGQAGVPIGWPRRSPIGVKSQTWMVGQSTGISPASGSGSGLSPSLPRSCSLGGVSPPNWAAHPMSCTPDLGTGFPLPQRSLLTHQSS